MSGDSVAVNVAVTQSSSAQGQQVGNTQQVAVRQPAQSASSSSVLQAHQSQPTTLPLSVSSVLQALAKGQLKLPQVSATVPQPIVPKPRGQQVTGQLPSRSTQVSTGTQPNISISRSSSATGPDGRQQSTVNLNVRVINPERKSQYETYVLRNIGSHISTPILLKEEILKQLGSDIVSHKLDFSIGYVKGGTKVSIRTASDVQDVWLYLRRGNTVALWCSGIHSSHQSSSESDEDDYSRKPKRKKRKRVSALDEKNERVEEIVTNLRHKHGTQYTSIQYRLWGEMLDVGTHRSLDCPPKVPIFTGGREKRPSHIEMLTTAVSEMARAMSGGSSVTSPSPVTPISSAGSSQAPTPAAGISPAKVANLRSNYLQQMRDLHSLYESGALSENEFQEQKVPILQQLKSLSS